jgi:hypothetical protein
MTLAVIFQIPIQGRSDRHAVVPAQYDLVPLAFDFEHVPPVSEGIVSTTKYFAGTIRRTKSRAACSVEDAAVTIGVRIKADAKQKARVRIWHIGTAC